MPFLETSAKDSTNVEQAFLMIVEEIKHTEGPSIGGSGDIAVHLQPSHPIKDQKKSCC